MTPEYIEEIARAVVGDHKGWQARFAESSGISPAHLSNVLKGTRPVTSDFKARVRGVCIVQSLALRERADKVERFAIDLG
ncbi:hypothetical protein ASG47_14510 [Devosia sp. Leaf420]|uniref:hypothetical protein n=1 Tax=Devosia sp. Leaf420 TaxID=1736374 RepID=UPI00071529A0|nr:hypothetical protein [Devosia sp. Leaf420]KQT44663.1 hypothetical protein ASG47_14510 [Devosia sp. Leaf420]